MSAPMKIALIGHGKMGKLIEQLALQKGYTISAVINSKNPLSQASSRQAIAPADICIDFSHPHSAIENLKIAADMKKNVVMGTTGWTAQLDTAKNIVEKAGIGFLHAPNFSLGVALFLKVVEDAAALIAPFGQYDAAGIEIHHNQKLDAPSGTAKAIENKLNAHLSQPMNFSSVRVGNVPGTHSVIFDSPVDTITLTHTARSREGFAHGALAAAEWLRHKKGIFTLNDMLKPKS